MPYSSIQVYWSISAWLWVLLNPNHYANKPWKRIELLVIFDMQVDESDWLEEPISYWPLLKWVYAHPFLSTSAYFREDRCVRMQWHPLFHTYLRHKKTIPYLSWNTWLNSQWEPDVCRINHFRSCVWCLQRVT